MKLILASQSPRRIELMQLMQLQFTVQIAGETDEIYPLGLQREEISLYLARLKADFFLRETEIDDETVVITADTIVWIGDRVLGKPTDRQDAVNILKTLSDNTHQVFTGVCLTTNNKRHSFFDESKVFFRHLTDDEIHFYIDRWQPYDKAGAYGIQEWIGYVGIEKIEGSHTNVMGLPTQKLYCALRDFGALRTIEKKI